MIRKVFSNKSSFKTVEFTPGLNVVLADRTKESTKRDSRNGLGKSTLIEIIHFCLGARAVKNKGLLVDSLSEWEFSIVIEVNGKNYTISRAIDKPKFISIEGDISDWPYIPKNQNGKFVFTWSELNEVLGMVLFGLGEIPSDLKYAPSFRSLISYFIRRGKDAFSVPFEHYRKQKEWDKQVHNAYLLGLAWETASEQQSLKDKKKGIENFKKAAKSGVVKGFVGTLGDLDAQRIRIESQIEKEQEQLSSFKVHPQYEKIQSEANSLTSEIHDLLNKNSTDNRILQFYSSTLIEEKEPLKKDVERIYKEAGAVFQTDSLKRLEEVHDFHKTIVENRRSFLESEIGILRRNVEARNALVEEKTERRSVIMQVLKTHGALEEYNVLQKRLADITTKLLEVKAAMENLKSFQKGLSEIKIEQEVIQQRAAREYDERKGIREKAVSLFNSFSEALYNAPGKLLIDISSNGFSFDVKIERSDSTGIGNMKIFCYDLTLARLWAGRQKSLRALIHDSIIFDGVDDRQHALALETASIESEENNFQYICTLNSDDIPYEEFTKGFKLDKFIRLTLTDEKQDGSLLGIKF